MMVMITAGGPVMWTVAALGFAAAVLFLVRLVDLRRAKIDYADFIAGVENLLEKGNGREVVAICDDTPAPVARVVAAAVRRRGGSDSELREATDAAVRNEVRRFSRRLSVLQTVAQISPLLGLFGTVTGFARALAAIGGKTLATRADLLPLMAPALACAAAGLLVAVLSHVMYALLRSRLDHLIADLDAAAGDIRLKMGGKG
jgi:biopolymer transport protein ExbB